MNFFNNLVKLNKVKIDFLDKIQIFYSFNDGKNLLIVTKHDEVYAIGENNCGHLGLNHNELVEELTLVENLCNQKIVKFSSYSNVMALSEDGQIFCWGDNHFGLLGDGTQTSSYNPKRVEALLEEQIISICCGFSFCSALAKSGNLFSWGINFFGELGTGNKNKQLTPIKIKKFASEKLICISNGPYHSLALTENGNVYSWGWNSSGQLGLGDIEHSYGPKRIIIHKEDGSDLQFKKISCGFNYSILLSSEGDIFTFGCNRFGELGSANRENHFIPIKISHSSKFVDIASHSSKSITAALSKEDKYFICGRCGSENVMELKETTSNSFLEIFIDFEKVTITPWNIYTEKLEFTVKNYFRSKLKNSMESDRLLSFNIEKGLLCEELPIDRVIRKYEMLRNLDKELIESMKIIYVTGKKYKDVLFVTKDDIFYAFGENLSGFLGQDNDSPLEIPQVITELCGKEIIDIVSGEKHIMARTRNGKVYAWGLNSWGQLGLGKTTGYNPKPELSLYLSDKKVVQISCGIWLSLALTRFGEIYTWGHTKPGEFASKNFDKQFSPIMIDGFNSERVIAISSGTLHSLALTINGKVYSWGYNNDGQLGIGNYTDYAEPQLIKFENEGNCDIRIKKISCGPYYSLILSRDGIIYAFGSNFYGQLGLGCRKKQNIPIKLLHEKKFIDIATSNLIDLSVTLSEDNQYYVWGKCGENELTEPFATHHKSFDIIFAIYGQITYKPISFDEYSWKFQDSNNILNGKCDHQFLEHSVIAFGNCGVVLKVQNKSDDKIYAIKKIPFSTGDLKKVSKEIQILLKLNNEFIVQYKCAWIEENYYIGQSKVAKTGIHSNHRVFDPNKVELLHIQMQFCSKTLKHIELILKGLLKNSFGLLIHYYIASELFVEILEGVDYLHSQNPPIIHRDLKPSNILITDEFRGGFIKLADFGFSTIHEFDEQSHTQGLGTLAFMAPEVSRSRNYNMKADIFSLGVIMEELFDIDLNMSPLENENMTSNLSSKYVKAIDLIDLMKRERISDRPECKVIINERKSWTLDEDEIRNAFNNENILKVFESSFIITFLKSKGVLEN